MRDDWTVTTLDELVLSGVILLGRGNVISKKDMEADPGPFPVYSSAQNNDGRIGTYNQFMFDEELITWSVDGGGYVFYRKHHKFSVTNIGGYLRILDKSKFLYPFLAAVLQKLHSEHVFDWQNKAHPSVIRKLYNNIPLAPIDEQKRIVNVVSSVDAYIDALQQQVDAARTARNAVLHELLSAGGDDWTETTLGDISTFVGARATPESLNPATLYVGLEHVDPKTPLITRWGDISSVSSSVTPFEPEDVLFGRLRPYLHKVAFADFAGVCTPEILVLRSSTNCDSRYLHLICSMDSTVKACVEMSAGTRMPRTSTTDLASIQILLPSIAEQQRIVEIVSSMDDVIQATEGAVVEAKNLRSGLLSDLLSGEHEIPVSYDELLGAA